MGDTLPPPSLDPEAVSSLMDVADSWSVESIDPAPIDSDPVPSPGLTRPAIDFAELPDPEEIPGTAWPAPLQRRIADLTGQHVDISLHRPPTRKLGRDAPMELPPRYRWISTLGEGGQGTVELVLDRDLGRTVALKTLLPNKTSERHLLDLYREARITGQLDHPHVITIYDAGQLPDGRLFYTMPRMPGDSLHEVLVRLRRNNASTYKRWGGLVPLVQVLEKACHGVGFAHARGVIHRDLKPANILLGSHGEVLVVDWGIARIVGGPSADSHRVGRLWSLPGDERHERVRGSPPYMAPEQVQHPDQVSAAADVFCLGVMLYEALTGVPPWNAPEVDEIVDALCHDKPVPPRERTPHRSVPAELEEICLRALEKFPGHRYPNATEMAEALDQFLSGGRRRETAARRLREADSMRTRHRALSQRTEEATAAVATARRPVGTDTLRGELDDLRHLSERAESLQRASDGVFSEAVWALHQALAADPDDAGARELLGELYADRFADAERRGARREEAWFRALLRQFNDGRWGRWLRTGAELTAATLPEDTPLELFRLTEQDGRLVPTEVVAVGEQGRWQLPPGRYALGRPEADGGWRYPLLLRREERRHVVLDLRGEEATGESFCFVPGGPALVGGDPDASGAGPARTVEIPTFAIARHPVTVGAYARFLAWVGEDRVDVARAHRPPDFDDQVRAGDQRPVTSVTARDAEAWCRWVSAQTGTAVRLPTADEWEKSARAADGRRYPWGDRFAPDDCASLWGGAPGGPPPHVGSHPADRSPFGVEDCGGGVWEWTATALDDRRAAVGGSIVSEAAGCRSAVRRALRPGACLGFLGFRVVMELPEEE